MHFFTPAHIMRLMEIVQGAHTSLESSRAALAIARRLGKVGVLVSECVRDGQAVPCCGVPCLAFYSTAPNISTSIRY
jgi:3-hydroxyacyl-CoA dehydrogenase